MLIAHYIGDHAGEAVLTQAGRYLTEVSQRGAFKNVTHTEAVLQLNLDGSVSIGSASIRDKGVRIKEGVFLKRTNWLITEMQMWDATASRAFITPRIGLPYDKFGAVATVLPGHTSPNQFFCTQLVGASVGVREPHIFGPGQFATMCFTFGIDRTDRFFDWYESLI